MKKLYLQSFHEKAGANFITIEDHSIPGDYGNIVEELDAISKNVGLLDRSYLGKVALTGPDSLDLLNRISTNDLQHLAIGTMVDTIFVTPKGRLIDYCRVINTGEELILIGSFLNSGHLSSWINRFVIFEDMEVRDVSDEYIWMTLLGSHCKTFMAPFCEKPIADNDEAIWLSAGKSTFPALKNNNFKLPAYNFCFDKKQAEWIVADLSKRLALVDGRLVGDTAFQVMRVESGMPDWGTEITQDYNPHEARLTNAISFTKGCYTGQEVIARLDTYEKVQKKLMIVDLDQSLTNKPPLEIFIDDESVGILTSYVYNPIENRSVGLGYVKKMYTTENDLYVEVVSQRARIPASLRLPPQAYSDK